MSCEDYPTAQTAKTFKLDAETVNEVVTLEQDRTSEASDGKTKKTLWGIETDATNQRDEFEQLASDQRDNFEVNFSSQFNFKRIGNISDYAGQSLMEAEKLNSYQFPDDSGDWYVPEQGQSFPVTIPADPTVAGSNWYLQSPSGVYRGLWPDTGGVANKGDTYQTQAIGTPTGQYFTALQNTTVDPVGDGVNWREVVSVASFSKYTDIVYKSSASNSAVENMLSEFNLNPLMYEIGTSIKSGATNFSYEDSTGPVTLANFRALNVVHVDDFAKRDETDYYTAIQTAIDYVASLPPSEHDGSYTFGYNVGASRGVIFNPVRYPVSQSVVMKNNVSLFANKASLSASAGFAVGDPILTTDGSSISASVTNLTLDGNGQDIKGVLLPEIFNCVWSDITILNCGDDSFTVQAGAQFNLNGFSFSCSDTPVSNKVAGLKVSTADMMFSNGVCQWHPVGVYIDGNGNNEYVNIHCWGAYTERPQYINFYLKNTFRNTFTNCYGDSPTKQDFAFDNSTQVGSFPNGGVAFYLEREGTIASGSQANVFINSRVFCNKTNWDNAGLSGQHLLYGYIDANCFFNQFINTVRVEGDTRVPFLDDVWEYWNSDINRSTTIFDNEIKKVESLTIGDGSCGIFSGTGSPEGELTENPGSIYLRSDGGVGSSLYVKSSGFGTDTGWIGQGEGSAEGIKTASIGTGTPLVRVTPVGFGATSLEVDVTAIETAGYVGLAVRKYKFAIITTATTTIVTPTIISDHSVTNSNPNYIIDAAVTATDIGGGVVEIGVLVTESGALNPTEAEVKFIVSSASTKKGLKIDVT